MFKDASTNSHKRLPPHGGFFDLPQKQQLLKELEDKMSQPDFWSDNMAAAKTSREFDELKKEVELWQRMQEESQALDELAQETGDSEELQSQIEKLEKDFTQLEFTMMLSGEYDANDAVFAIHAGAGGTDAQDWAEMLKRMYLRYFERKGWTAKVIDESRGSEAGIKSVTMEVLGRYAYGYLKAEAGVHRLVRISPFDAEKMRHTSFALVEVIPDFGDLPDIVIDEKDLKIEASTASGHGGQSVNTTYSAIRIVHLPTKITVQCQNERSQKQNLETAMKILKQKLHMRRLEEQEEKRKELRGEFHSAEWGNQIRSYVLHPYKMVKDHRTKHEGDNPQAVLDGDLDGFIEAYLKGEGAVI
ncbi:MAG: peptide chain release factor 2 [Candidatus Nomurabacteria bacterium]|nr:MAG: peptide chain release factor 2 [Candidatus Nomurabacteria bacterium]